MVSHAKTYQRTRKTCVLDLPSPSHLPLSLLPSFSLPIRLRRDGCVVASLVEVCASPSVTDRPRLAKLDSELSSLFRDNRFDDSPRVGGSGAPCLLWPSGKSDAAPPSGGADTEDVGGEKRPLGEKQVVICKLKPLRVRNIGGDSQRGCALWHPANLPSQSDDEYQLF